MAQKALGGFDILVELAGNFVEGQKGVVAIPSSWAYSK